MTLPSLFGDMRGGEKTNRAISVDFIGFFLSNHKSRESTSLYFLTETNLPKPFYLPVKWLI